MSPMHPREVLVVLIGPDFSGKNTTLQQVALFYPDSKWIPTGSPFYEDLLTWSESDSSLLLHFTRLEKLQALCKFHSDASYFLEDPRCRDDVKTLQNADVIVHTFDSQTERMWYCLRFLKLVDDLLGTAKSPARLIQLNKIELPNAVSAEKVVEELKNRRFPIVPTVAVTGEGIPELVETVWRLGKGRLQTD